MKRASSIRASVLLVALAIPAALRAGDYAIGADVSFLRQAEQQGVVFKDGGKGKPGLQILQEHGYGWVRLRLFHTPTELPNDLSYTIALAKDAKKLGMKFLLDYHYADGWADPRKAADPESVAGQITRGPRAGRVRVHARHDCRVSRCGRAAGNGSDRQRSDQRHSLAGRQAAGAVGQLRAAHLCRASTASMRGAATGRDRRS